VQNSENFGFAVSSKQFMSHLEVCHKDVLECLYEEGKDTIEREKMVFDGVSDEGYFIYTGLGLSLQNLQTLTLIARDQEGRVNGYHSFRIIRK
jgi:hypothetical protein